MVHKAGYDHRARRLRGVAVQRDVVLGENRAEFRDGLNRPHFVVDGHNGGHENVVVESPPERVGVDEPVVVDVQRLDDKSVLFRERAGGGKHALVLDSADEEAITRWGGANSQTEQRKIVGFRGARREDDLLGIRVDQRPDGGSRFLHRACRTPPDGMLGRVRVAKGVMPERRHGVDDAGVRRCRGLIVCVHKG